MRNFKRRNFAYTRKKQKKNFPLFFLIILIFIFGSFYLKYRSDIYKPIDPDNNQEISFQINKGQSVKKIAQNLEEQNLISNSRSFYIYTKINKLGEKIIAGRFLLNQNMNVPTILETITNPQKGQVILTIQEGLMLRDIDKKLVEFDLISEGEFLNAIKNFNNWEKYNFLNKNKLISLDFPLEGYIFPDTYYLNPGNFHPDHLISMTLNNFEKKLKEIKNKLNSSSKNLHEIITMASILENEVRSFKDRQIVAGILWKRIENNWRVDADATLLYIMETRNITARELAIDSPYNTRKKHGLPPGPISNPGLESIKAALTPQPSNYWFYLTTLDTGKVIYSRTNDEHNQNRAKYL